MRICFVCSEYPPARHGGIGIATQDLARLLADRGHHVTVVGVYRRQEDDIIRENDRGVDVWRLRESRAAKGSSLLSRLRLYLAVRRWAASGAIDLVEVPDFGGWAAHWRELRVPVLVRLHGTTTHASLDMGRPVSERMRWMERRSLLRRDGWCSASTYLARRTMEIFRLDGAPPDVIYHGVPLPRLRPFEERFPSRVVFAGTLKSVKGITHLLSAWPHVLRAVPDAELHLYGKFGRLADGTPFDRALPRLIPDRVGAGVTLHGPVDRLDVTAALSRAAAGIFPSLKEGLGLAPLEAMAAGCATIFTKRGPGPELIRDGIDGFLVEPESEDEIAGRLIDVLSDRDLARRLGAAARKTVEERFTLERWVEQTESFYTEAIDAFRYRVG